MVEALRHEYGDDHYMSRFQKPGEIEAEFAKMSYQTFNPTRESGRNYGWNKLLSSSSFELGGDFTMEGC
ncbi:hypothetical protein QVD17_40566 [Tagetes erecta]|uniref:Uncharacterized protein n=1 Tax=Tagetes erecta TaxID=13708 RepID=A0AAD8NHW6_TARER|nr:hypothetical protein QVD17_40566 [Tagetes erecta]